MDTVGEQVVSWTEFGAQLRHWRRRANLSQTQVGARVGYHHSVISKLESGTRKPSSQLVRRLDEVLETGGGLAQAFTSGDRPRWDLLDRITGADSAGNGEFRSPARDIALSGMIAWPSRLPCYGLSCPMHGAIGCDVPAAEAAVALYAAFCAGERSGVDADTVHVLTALVAAYARIAAEEASSEIVTAVEQALRALAQSLQALAMRPPRALLRLASTYAVLAGEQRMVRGQHGAAMAWYGKSLHWAGSADDVELRMIALCDMSTLSRLEHDAPNALVYAQAMRVAEHERPWVSTLAYLYEARGCALLGDYSATVRNVDLARDGLARLGERDQQEAPWLSGVYGQVFVESGAGAALRDMAAATADRAAAQSAVRAMEHSLTHLPLQMRPFRTLMTLRLADSYACAGEPESAVAVALPSVNEAAEVSTSCIRQEMRGLRSRLMARWSEHPKVRDFIDRTGGHHP